MATAAKYDKLAAMSMPMTDNLDEVASYAERRWGFTRISCSDKLPENPHQLDEETKTRVIRNMKILKNLPSEEKLGIIGTCLKDKSDYLGVRYLELYGAHMLKSKQEAREEIESNTKGVVDLKKRERPCVVAHRDDDEEKEVEKKKKKKKKEEILIRADFESRIKELRGTEVNFLYEKELYDTDVNIINNRLSIPLNQIDDGFLKEDERAVLNRERPEKGSPVPHIDVSLLRDAGQTEKGLAFRRWDMKKQETGKVCTTYVLNGNWYKEVVVEEGLSPKMKVQLWSFRVGLRLWFALIKLGV